MSELVLDRNTIENAILKVSDEIISTQKRADWKAFTEEQLWFQLVSCILGSRVTEELAREHFRRLVVGGFLDYNALLNNPNKMREIISSELNKPLKVNYKSAVLSKYPFSRLRANHIVQTCNIIYKTKFKSIKKILESVDNSNGARNILMELCMGIGPKQASLFLRNISYCNNLAILDSRVTRYMHFIGLVKNKVEIKTKNQYLEYEDIFRDYSKYLNRPIGVLDLSVWITMKIIKEECDKYGYNSSYIWWR
jgi:N-glycosylase/DNA lyase